MNKIILLIVIFSFFAFGMSAFAQNSDLPSAGILPDSHFYFLKSWKESTQTFFTFGAENKAKQFLHLAEVRLAEYQKMIEKGKTEIAQKTLDKYEKQLGRVLEKADQAKKKGKDVGELAALIIEKTLKHQEILIEVFEKVPEEAKSGIEKAIEVSRKGSEEAVKAVTGAKKEELQQKIETADWKTYRNEQLGFEFKYPNTWLLRKETQVLKVIILEPARSKFKISISFLGLKRDYPEIPEIEKANAEKAFNIEYNEIKNCTKKKKINDIEFCMKEFACFEGNRITKYSAINQGDNLINIITFSHESGDFLRCLSDEDASSELKDFNQILFTFKFIELEEAKEETPKVEEEKKEEICNVPKAPVLTDPGISVTKLEVFTEKWTSVSGATKYQIQRDTNPNFSAPLSIPDYWIDFEQNSLTGNPNPKVTTTYYYRVRACNDCGCSAWSNVVDMQVIVPSIIVTSPNSGETWIKGSVQTIRWSSTGEFTYVLADLMRDSTVVKQISVGNSALTGSFTWEIPSNIPEGSNYKIRLTGSNAVGAYTTIYDESDNYFSIASPPPEPLPPPEPPPIETCPMPGDPIVSAEPPGPVNSGAEYSINWSIVGGASHYILQRDTNLTFSNPTTIRNSSPWHTQKESHSPSVSTMYWYKARAENSCGVGPWSNIVGIRVEVPVIPAVLEAPVFIDPGISVKKHEAFTLNWTSIKGAKRYWLQRDTSTNFSIPAWICETNSDTDNPGIGTSAPEVTATYYYRIKACDDQRCSAWSNVVDMRVIVPLITVTSPSGGEIWVQGETHRITWNSVGVSDVAISIKDPRISGNGSTEYITENRMPVSASPGYYDWTVSFGQISINEGDNFKIIINDFDNPGIKDESDGFFSILWPSFTITSPNGGEVWIEGETHRITWDSLGIKKIDHIEILKGDQVFKILSSTFTGNPGYYDWTIGSDFPVGSDYKVFILCTGNDDHPYGDHSDNYFSIVNP